MSAQELITEHLDLWTGAVKKKSSSGRGRNGKIELTGIKKLRELILELAVRGMLVDQHAGDGTSDLALNDIDLELTRPLAAKKESKTSVSGETVPYRIPSSWRWSRLGHISTINGGFAFKSSSYCPTGVRVIRISDFDERGFKAQNIVRHGYSDSLSNFQLKANNILMAMTGGTVGKSYLVKSLPEPMVVNQRVATIKLGPNLNPNFVHSALKTRIVRDVIQDAKNSTNDNISMKDIQNFVVPLPPLKEQHRIVRKVADLMALCDRLEQQTSDQLEAHETLVDTLLTTLTQSENADELSDNWARLAAHFDTLFTTEQSIDTLKQTILQLAVMGKLVRQEEGDEPAAQLLGAISTHKSKTGGSRQRRAQTPSPVNSFETSPFQIPSSWIWAPLRDIGFTSTGKTPSTKSPSFFSGDIPFLGPGQVTTSGEITEAEKHLSEDGLTSAEEALPGDILTVCIGGSIGKTAKVNSRCGFNQQLNKIRPTLVEPDYILAALNTDVVQTAIREKATGSATPIINRSKWESIQIPLAPLNEQKRIVRKVDELMTLCDQLKNRLNQASETRCQLASTVVDQALH